MNALRTHLTTLHRLGLTPIPGWGGGKILPGTDQRALALAPADLPEILATDYSGGLMILCGTENRYGGYVVGLDVDVGPATWPEMPPGFLYSELGTSAGKLHAFIRTTIRLEGRLNVFKVSDGEDQRHPVAELKGLNLSLRSWPSLPPDKPRGYTPHAYPLDPRTDPPTLTPKALAGYVADLITKLAGVPSRVALTPLRPPAPPRLQGAWEDGDLAERVERELNARGCALRPANRSGWSLGWCPFHEDRRKRSFSVNLTAGGWVCYAGCGSGYLVGLARRLDIWTERPKRPAPQSNQPAHTEPVSALDWKVRV